ncbi:MAG: MBL fold metallo-hydrolase [Candidatus Solibacter usitatus]|nr:MBL fold metallo-hydrolase [Candidatus Solibacter usitatus]
MPAFSRRGFLRRTLGATWTGAALLDQSVFRAAAARAQSTGAPTQLFDIEKVAEGVFAAIARPAALINCNAAIFVRSTDLLVVDTHSKPSAVAALVAQIKKDITPKPVRYIVNSHFHWDHTQGNPTYKKFAPRADIVASVATRRLLADNGPQRLKESVEQTQKSLEEMKAKATSASGSDKAYYQRMVAEMTAYLKEMQGYAPELPNITVDRTLVLQDPAHDLHIAFRGRAHTAGDVAVFCPQKRVLATGDALHGFLPYIADAYPAEWPRTLYDWAQFEFQHVIGGHAAVQHSKDRLYHMAAYLEEITEAVRKAKQAGRSVAQAQQTITPATLASLNRNGYGDFVAASIARYYPPGPNPTPAGILSEGVKTNVAHTYTALDRA